MKLSMPCLLYELEGKSVDMILFWMQFLARILDVICSCCIIRGYLAGLVVSDASLEHLKW